MKKQILLLNFLFLTLFVSFSVADDLQVITLKDGSQVKGTLIGVENGTYTVHTPAFGDVKVDASQVASISNGAPIQSQPESPAAAKENLDQKIQDAQNKLMSDPQMMQQLQVMVQDPELMKLISDPELTQAVMAHDTKAVESNPKTQELINNPKMRSLMEQLKSKTSSE